MVRESDHLRVEFRRTSLGRWGLEGYGYDCQMIWCLAMLLEDWHEAHLAVVELILVGFPGLAWDHDVSLGDGSKAGLLSRVIIGNESETNY